MNYTLDKAIASASTWTRTDTGVPLSASKTTFFEVEIIVKQTSGGYSSVIKKAFGVEYVSGAHQILGFAAGTTTASGTTLALDSNVTYGGTDDVQFVISSGTLFVEAMSAAAGSFRAVVRTVEV
jgi:hypothetical protein